MNDKDEFIVECSKCGQVLIRMKGKGPSIIGNGIKLSCRNCDENLKESLPIDDKKERI